MSLQEPARKVPKHLIDPATLADHRALSKQRQQDRAQDLEKLARVKQWVTSALVVTTMFHLSVGLIIAAIFIDEDRTDARIGLNVIAAILLVAGIAGARAIHGKKPVSLWLALGLVMPAVGLFLTFR
ncbi:hypothetical protein ABIE44_001925 [Marmoricola sp. OAE513]|uniref:hypothetical protein n=1 Tax=Marmoricola sp. OAE513 TaxID=2817894 RepID=UPI001AE58668